MNYYIAVGSARATRRAVPYSNATIDDMKNPTGQPLTYASPMPASVAHSPSATATRIVAAGRLVTCAAAAAGADEQAVDQQRAHRRYGNGRDDAQDCEEADVDETEPHAAHRSQRPD